MKTFLMVALVNALSLFSLRGQQKATTNWWYHTEYKTNLTIAFADLNAQIELFPFHAKYIGFNFFGGYFIGDEFEPFFQHRRTYFGLEWRFYAGGREEGFYFGPFFKYRRIHVNADYLLFDPVTGGANEVSQNLNNNTLFMGLSAGVKVPIHVNASAEFYVSFGRLIHRLPSDISLEETDVIFTVFHPRCGLVLSFHKSRKHNKGFLF